MRRLCAQDNRGMGGVAFWNDPRRMDDHRLVADSDRNGCRLRARESAALATSVHLVCRPRADDAPIGDWGEVHRELPRRVAEWMERLASRNIFVARIWFLHVSGRRWKFTAGIQKSLMLRIERFRWVVIQRQLSHISEDISLMCGRRLVELHWSRSWERPRRERETARRERWKRMRG